MRGGRAAKSRYVAALAASGALLLGWDTAVAGSSYPTKITHDSRTELSPDVYLDSGRVNSPKRVCEVLRVVKVIAHYTYEETPTVLDYDLTSYYGSWATRGNFAGAESAIARVTKRKLRRGGRRITCRADSVKLL